jgi:hypothetical protein
VKGDVVEMLTERSLLEKENFGGMLSGLCARINREKDIGSIW